MKYGLLAAAAMSAWLFASYALGLHTKYFAWGRIADWGTEAILVFALWRLLRDRLRVPGRTWLPVWQGLLHGLLASLVAAMGYFIALSLYLHYVNPDFPDLFLEWRVAELRAAGTPEEEVRNIARQFRWSTGIIGLPVTVLGGFMAIGFFLSPLFTLWLNWRHKEIPHLR